MGLGDATPDSKLDVEGTIKYNALQQESDRRLKNDIAPIPDALAKIDALRGVSYRWDKSLEQNASKDDGLRYGLIAQEVEKVFPELVGEDDGYKDLNYVGLIGPMVQAVKELRAEKNAEIADLKAEKDAEIASLKETHSEEIAALERRLAALEEHTGYGPRKAGLPLNAPLLVLVFLSGAGIFAAGYVARRRLD